MVLCIIFVSALPQIVDFVFKMVLFIQFYIDDTTINWYKRIFFYFFYLGMENVLYKILDGLNFSNKTIINKPGNSFVKLSAITSIQTNPLMSDFV